MQLRASPKDRGALQWEMRWGVGNKAHATGTGLRRARRRAPPLVKRINAVVEAARLLLAPSRALVLKARLEADLLDVGDEGPA